MTTKKLFEDSDLHIFKFRNFCAEDKSIELGDETEKIFLTTAGTADDITPEMEALMAYMTDKKTKTEFTKRLDEAIERIKAGEGWRLEYFQLKEKLDKSYNAGKRKGSIETLIESYRDFGASDETIKGKLKERFGLAPEEAEAYLIKR